MFGETYEKVSDTISKLYAEAGEIVEWLSAGIGAPGLIVSGVFGAAVGLLLSLIWRAARFGVYGAPLFGALSALPAAVLLQLLGGGALGFTPGYGTIEWRPVIATLFAAGACGGLAVSTLALLRVDFDPARPIQALSAGARGATRATAPYVVLAFGFIFVFLGGLVRQIAVQAPRLVRRLLGAGGSTAKASDTPSSGAGPRRRARDTADRAAPETTAATEPGSPPRPLDSSAAGAALARARALAVASDGPPPEPAAVPSPAPPAEPPARLRRRRRRRDREEHGLDGG